MGRGIDTRDLVVAELAVAFDVRTAQGVAAIVERRARESGRPRTAIREELARVVRLSEGELVRLAEEIGRPLGRRVASDAGDAVPDLGRRRGPARRAGASGAARYRDFVPVAAGGMGIVYRARDSELGRDVALKLLRTPDARRGASDPLRARAPEIGSADRAEFERRAALLVAEARVTGALEHPGVVPVHDVGETEGGVPYFTMRYVRGGRTLEDAVREAADPPARISLLRPFLRVCDTLRYAHSRGVLHGDVKPANVALGESGEVVLLDWGLARETARRGVGGRAVGTPGYMSPEAAGVLAADLSESSDVYALGATLQAILTGRPPIVAASLEELQLRLAHAPPPSPADLGPATPPGLASICVRALAPDPSERHPDVAGLAAAVRAWRRESARGRGTHAVPEEAGPTAAREAPPSAEPVER